MESSLKKLDSNNYQLTVELGGPELKSYFKEAEDDIVQNFQADGFRKGKAPRELVRKKIGDQMILEAALDLAVRKSLAEAVEKQGLEVMKISDLAVKENSAFKLLYSAAVTIFPNIVLGDVSSVKVKKTDVSVEKAEISQTLDSIRDSRAKLVKKDGKAQRGDRVEINFEITSEDGLPIEGGISKNHPVIIGDNKFIPGFEDEIINTEIGEEKKFSLSVPRDYFNKSIAGRRLNFFIKVLNIQKIIKPDLDDSFARSLGKFSGLSDLEKNIVEGILEEKKIKERQKLRLEILAEILKKSKMELPPKMVSERLDEMITGFDGDLHEKGLELSIYLAHLQKTEDDLRKDWQKEAERQVAFSLVLRKVAKEKKLNPSDEEVEEGVNSMIQKMITEGRLTQEGIENIDLSSIREAVANDLVIEKAFAFLEKECVVG